MLKSGKSAKCSLPKENIQQFRGAVREKFIAYIALFQRLQRNGRAR